MSRYRFRDQVNEAWLAVPVGTKVVFRTNQDSFWHTEFLFGVVDDVDLYKGLTIVQTSLEGYKSETSCGGFSEDSWAHYVILWDKPVGHARVTKTGFTYGTRRPSAGYTYEGPFEEKATYAYHCGHGCD